MTFEGKDWATDVLLLELAKVAAKEDGNGTWNIWMNSLSWVVNVSRELESQTTCPDVSKGYIVVTWCMQSGSPYFTWQ